MSDKPISRAPEAPPRVVVVGAGFGGLAVARGLRKISADVLLVDQRNHHLFQPMLYQVAMGQLMPGDIAEPLRNLFGNHPTVAPRMDAVEGIDLDARQVDFASGRSTGYDMLVLATGARFQYLGHPEWEQHVLTLKNLDQAMTMRGHIFSALERADHAETDDERRAHLNFVIIGAGPTGVELAGAMGRLLPGIIDNQFPGLDRKELHISLVEPLPHALGGMHESLGRYTDKKLRATGVDFKTEVAVEGIEAGRVHMGDAGSIRAETIIWAAGMEGTGAGDWLPDELVEKHNMVPVEGDLSVPGHPEVFVVGDANVSTDEDGNPYPGLASVAKQQGAYVASMVRHRLGDPRSKPAERFRLTDYGTMAIISNGCAVAQIRGHHLKGFFAWLLWGLVHLYFLVSSRNRILVLGGWIWAMLTGRGQRVILGSHAGSGRGRKETKDSSHRRHKEAS